MASMKRLALLTGALALAGAAGFATYAAAGQGKGWHRSHHGNNFRGHRVERMLERFDSDKDGKLTQDELNEARKQLLAKHDGDKDQSLTLAEFEKLWLEVMRRRMVRGFQRLDEDGDAKITVDEFLKPFAHAVEHMDRNGDGSISREDRHRRGSRSQDNDSGDRGHPRGSHGQREG